MSVVGAAIGLAGAVYGSKKSKKASDNATAASERGTELTIAENARQYDQTREDYAYLREMGQGAAGRMESVMGGDMSAFQTSPGYQFRLDQSNQTLGNQFSNASGGGNAMMALAEHNQNFASNEFGNWWNRNAGMVGAGQQATAGTAAAGAQMAQNNSSAYMANAGNQGNVGLWNANNQNNMVQGGLSNALYGYQNRDTTDDKWWT